MKVAYASTKCSIAVVVSLALSACSTDHPVTDEPRDLTAPGRPAPMVTSSSTAAETATQWRNYAADVEVFVSGDPAMPPSIRSSQSVRYHLVRSREPDGVWASRVTLDTTGLAGRAAGASQGPVELDMRDDGARLTMTDATGKPFAAEQDVASAPPLRPGDNQFLSVPPLAEVKRTTGHLVNPDAWLQSVLVDSGARVAIAQKLAQYAAAGSAETGDRKRYVIVPTAGRTIEILTDAVSGGIVQESLFDGSRLAQQTTHRFEQRPGQVWVRTYTRTEVQAPDGKSTPRLIERY